MKEEEYKPIGSSVEVATAAGVAGVAAGVGLVSQLASNEQPSTPPERPLPAHVAKENPGTNPAPVVNEYQYQPNKSQQQPDGPQ
jgi:hypothetical protein